MALNASDRVQSHISWCIKPGAVAQNAPCGSCQFVGERDSRLVSRHSRHSSGQPCTKAEVRPSGPPHHDHLCGLHEEHAKVSAAAFGNPPEDGSAPRAVLCRHEAKPCRKITTAIKSLAFAPE